MEISVIFRTSGLGSRLFTVDRLAGWLADKNLLFFEVYKIRKQAELATFW